MNPRAPLLALTFFTGFAALAPAATPAAPAVPPTRAPAAADEDEDEPLVETPAVPKPDPALEKFWAAVQLLEGGQAADLPRGRKLLQEAADLENTHAQVQLANCLAAGAYGFPKNARKAAALFRLAAERGNAFAKVSLGQCLLGGAGIRRDPKQARGWLTAALAADADFSRPVPPAGAVSAAAAAGSAVAGELAADPAARAQASAHYLLGLLDEEAKQTAEAQKHFVAAATAGPAGRDGLFPAAIQAALNYAFGQGGPRDPAAANAMLDRSRQLVNRMRVTQLHSYAGLRQVDEFAVGEIEEQLAEQSQRLQSELQVKIASTFADRKSKEYNPAEAAKWFELAAENKQAWAMTALGLLLARGDLGAPDPAKAFGWFERAGGGVKPKHLLAAANLALCHLRGFGTPPDPAKAGEIFRRFRDREFACYLGDLGQAPAGFVSYDESVALNETWAKTRKDAHAQYLLGLRYLNGWGYDEDFGKAVSWIKKAADAGDPAACGMLGFLYSAQGRDAAMIKRYWEKGLAGRDARSAVGLAMRDEPLPGGPIAGGRSLGLYEQAVAFDPEFAIAHERLAALLFRQHRSDLEALQAGRLANDAAATRRAEEARERIRRHWNEADRLESERAPYELGVMALEGKVEPKDFTRAYALLESAAARGHAEAHYRLGQLHENGDGVAVTPSEAAYHYRLAALEGHRDALRRLANFYLTGRGVSQDLERAQFWIGLLARTGDNKALVAFGDLAMRRGEYAPAVRLWRALARSGDHYLVGCSAERLSRCYRDGLGVKPDAARAKKYFDRAMAFDNAEAQVRTARQRLADGNVDGAVSLFELAANRSGEAAYELGRLLFFGERLAKDESKAWRLLRRAADADQGDALYFLATTTYQRLPGAPALDEAIRFAQSAESIGHAKATRLRELLEQRRDQPEAPAAEEFAPPRPV